MRLRASSSFASSHSCVIASIFGFSYQPNQPAAPRPRNYVVTTGLRMVPPVNHVWNTGQPPFSTGPLRQRNSKLYQGTPHATEFSRKYQVDADRLEVLQSLPS